MGRCLLGEPERPRCVLLIKENLPYCSMAEKKQNYWTLDRVMWLHHSTARHRLHKAILPDLHLQPEIDAASDVFVQQNQAGIVFLTDGALAHLARARHSHCRGGRFESAMLHQIHETGDRRIRFVLSPENVVLCLISAGTGRRRCCRQP